MAPLREVILKKQESKLPTDATYNISKIIK